MGDNQSFKSSSTLYCRRLTELLVRIADQKHLRAIRQGLLLNMPVMVVGSFASLLVNLPLPAYQSFMISIFGTHWQSLGVSVCNATIGMVSVLLVLVISYFLTEASTPAKNGIIHPVMTSITALACLITLVQPINSQGLTGLSFNWLGIGGIFPAILTALLASEIFLYMSSLRKMRIGVFFDGADPVVTQALAGILPFGVTLCIFALLKFAAVNNGIADLHQFFYDFIKDPFIEQSATLGTAIKYHLLVQILWFFGMHGQNVLGAVQSLYAAAAEQNMAAYLAGEQPAEILTTAFLDAFSTIGGAGSTLCLIIAILILSPKGNTSKLAKLSIFPGVFNINELLVFGLPIALNPLYLIPFLLVPVMMTLLSYAAMAAGLVPLTNTVIHWTTPVLLSGYLATRSWTGIALQFFSIIAGVLIYLPFVSFANKQKQVEMQHALDNFFKLSLAPQTVIQSLLNRSDDAGKLARVLAQDMKEALTKREFTLEYQPQVNQNNRVTGVEALLRWSHKTFGRIPPPLIIMIAEESGLIHDLGKWVIDTACRQLRLWKDAGTNITMSVNISAIQLQQESLLDYVSQAVSNNAILPQELEIEITESIAIDNNSQTQAVLDSIHRMGVRIAIDDFGMGHSSLTYIKKFPVDTLKIDRSLSLDITRDKNSKEIVATIIALCASLDIKTIVEYVETEEQRDILCQLGSVHCQGYLYSPALPPEKALLYIKQLNKAANETHS
jgi:lactose/cellobiose-specific phosphotransferase system IIC component